VYADIGSGFTGDIGALGGAALSTRFGLQQVFVMAMPVAMAALLCALRLRTVSVQVAHSFESE
jgi:hypothetical protein